MINEEKSVRWSCSECRSTRKDISFVQTQAFGHHAVGDKSDELLSLPPTFFFFFLWCKTQQLAATPGQMGRTPSRLTIAVCLCPRICLWIVSAAVKQLWAVPVGLQTVGHCFLLSLQQQGDRERKKRKKGQRNTFKADLDEMNGAKKDFDGLDRAFAALECNHYVKYLSCHVKPNTEQLFKCWADVEKHSLVWLGRFSAYRTCWLTKLVWPEA